MGVINIKIITEQRKKIAGEIERRGKVSVCGD